MFFLVVIIISRIKIKIERIIWMKIYTFVVIQTISENEKILPIH